MNWIIAAAIVSTLCIIIRGFMYTSRDFSIDFRWWLLVFCAMIPNVLVYIGLHNLLVCTENTGVDHSSILSVLSLLSAGVIAGNFAFSYQDASDDEIILPNAISLVFVNLFYLLFGAVTYYFAESTDVLSVSGFTWILPTIMTLILTANTLNNYWDYREVSE